MENRNRGSLACPSPPSRRGSPPYGPGGVPPLAHTGSENEYLHTQLRSWGTVSFINQYVPAEATIALLFTGERFYIEQSTILGSVEDHTPARAWLMKHEDDSLKTLQAAGVTHILYKRT